VGARHPHALPLRIVPMDVEAPHGLARCLWAQGRVVLTMAMIILGSGIEFHGATIFRPKAGVMVVTNPRAMFGEKTGIGWMLLQQQATKEKRELIAVWDYYENHALELQTMNRLRKHGLLED